MTEQRNYHTLAIPVTGVERLLIETHASDPVVEWSNNEAMWVESGEKHLWTVNGKIEFVGVPMYYVRVSCRSADPVTLDLSFPDRSDVASYRLLPHRVTPIALNRYDDGPGDVTSEDCAKLEGICNERPAMFKWHADGDGRCHSGCEAWDGGGCEFLDSLPWEVFAAPTPAKNSPCPFAILARVLVIRS
jgi:hypothetical protein